MKKLRIPIILIGIGSLLFGVSFIGFDNEKTDLEIQIEKADFIMPAAHRVYSNSEALDGKYYLFKAKIDNDGNKLLEDVTVKYRIPGFIDWTTLEISGQLFPGQSLVVPCYPKFPDNITEKSTSSVEKVEIEVSWDGAKEDDIISEDFGFKLTNRNEYVYTGIKQEEISGWADVYDNDKLIACFVTPNDPIIKYYTQNLQEKLLKGEAASVTQKPEDGVRFLMGIYEATRKAHMVYSGTKGIPQSTDDVKSMVQQVRLPREVVTGNTGLCIELSCLYASVMSAAGLDPVIYFVPGHAYPGFRMNGQYYAIEATAINGEGLGGVSSVEDAFKTGQKQLQEFIQRAQTGDPRYNIVDIHAINQEGVTSMDLKDDSFLRRKVDEIAATWVGGNKPKYKVIKETIIKNVPNPNPPIRKNNFSVQIPTGWQVVSYPVPQMPIVTAQAIAPDQMTTITVFDVPVSNTREALQIINKNFSIVNRAMDYKINGQNLIGQTYSDLGTFNWIGKSLKTSNGVRIVAVGTADYLFEESGTVINKIYNTIR